MNVQGVTPILNVSDMQASFDWFERLGWQKGWDWGEPVSFGGVCSGESDLFLCLDGQGGRGKGSNTRTFGAHGNERTDAGVWVSLWLDSEAAVNEAYRHCLEVGIEVTQEPENMPWGVREMHIRHPDGHVFRVGYGLENKTSAE